MLAHEDVAIGWLYGVGCSIFAKEVPTGTGVADALGVKTKNGKEDVYYIECKASRSDLICAKQKLVYRNAIGDIEPWCWEHDPDMYKSMFADQGIDRTRGWENCPRCITAKKAKADTGIDFYYLLVADGLTVERSLYPHFGFINSKGVVIRKPKRMHRESDARPLIVNVAHVLVYKVFGKLYAGDATSLTVS